MKTIASLLVGSIVVGVYRAVTDQGNIIRLLLESDSVDHLGSQITIPEEVLPDYEEDIRANYYRQDPPFDVKTDIDPDDFVELEGLEDDEIGEPQGEA